MINYYQILGVNETAGSAEIKAAFRKLAKIWHPDKNPAGAEQFNRILKAYEILNDPSARRSYDLKLKYHRNAKQPAQRKPGTKQWSFEEKEMQRRKYYDEHIRKYAKTTSVPKVDPRDIKTSYNEYKYILYATPLAVALFLLIVNLATGSKPIVRQAGTEKPVTEELMRNGDAPFSEYFGKAQYELSNSSVLTLKNMSGLDMIVCLFSDKDFVRCTYLTDGVSAAIAQLPKGNLEVRIMNGRNWKTDSMNEGTAVSGKFTDKLSYLRTVITDDGGDREVTLTGASEETETIGPKTYFSKNDP